MSWKIESPSFDNPSEYLTIFNGAAYDFDTDFNNPTTFPEYDPTAMYVINDEVLESGVAYRCNTNILVPEAFNPSNWDAFSYSASSTYIVGDVVYEAGNTYSCNTAIPVPETFTPAKWDVFNEVEIFYPFDIGYRKDQVLRLTFFSADGNDVEVLGDSAFNLPYFETRFQDQTFENAYPTDDTETSEIFNWSGQKIQDELDFVVNPVLITSDTELTNNYTFMVDTTSGTVNLTVGSDLGAFWVGDYDKTWSNSDKVVIDFGTDTLELKKSNRDKRYYFQKYGSTFRVYDADGGFKVEVNI